MTDDEKQIRDLVESWMARSRAGDVEGVLALMTDDVIFVTPGRPPFGKREFAADGERMRDVEIDGLSERAGCRHITLRASPACHSSSVRCL